MTKAPFSHILAVDVETTGLVFNTSLPYEDPAANIKHQCVSVGVCVADANTLEIVDENYVEIKWNEKSLNQKLTDPGFGHAAEKVHGLSIDHLDSNGITEEQAVISLMATIMKYWGVSSPIVLLGHNVGTFDVHFIRELFVRHGIHVRFSNRMIDSNTMGYVMFNTSTSDELFNLLLGGERTAHNSLDDAKMSLECVKIMKNLCRDLV